MGREGGGGGGGSEEGAVDLNRASVRKPISCLPSPAIPLLLGCALPPAWPVAVNVEEAKGQLGSVGWERGGERERAFLHGGLGQYQILLVFFHS